MAVKLCLPPLLLLLLLRLRSPPPPLLLLCMTMQVGVLVETWQKYGGEVISGLRQHALPPAQVRSTSTLCLL